MPSHFPGRSRLIALAPAILIVVLAAVPVLGQEVPGGEALYLPFMLVLAVGVVAYIYLAIALQTIAKKVHARHAWWAWIPILQIVLSLQIAKRSLWWILLFIIPITLQTLFSAHLVNLSLSMVIFGAALVFLMNLAILAFIWVGIAKVLQKPGWVGILVIVPVVGLVVPGYLAWSTSAAPAVSEPVV